VPRLDLVFDISRTTRRERAPSAARGGLRNVRTSSGSAALPAAALDGDPLDVSSMNFFASA